MLKEYLNKFYIIYLNNILAFLNNKKDYKKIYHKDIKDL